MVRWPFGLPPPPVQEHQTATASVRRPQRVVPDCAVYPYVPGVHGPDFLLYFWQQVQQCGEQQRIFGRPYGESPSLFQAAMQVCEVVVISTAENAGSWRQGEDIWGCVWLDDVLYPCRARLHFWVAPRYRWPLCSDRFAQTALRYLFAYRQFRMLYGVIPVTNRLAVRFALRQGFRRVGRWPEGVFQDGMYPVDGVEVQLTAKEFFDRLKDNEAETQDEG